MVPAPEQSVVMSHVTSAAISVALINWLKKSSWFPWITQEKTKVMRLAAYVTAAVGAVGIHYTWNPAARTLSFDIPTVASMFAIAVAYVKSFAMQEITYQATRGTNLGELVKAVVAAIQPAPQPGPAIAAPAPPLHTGG
jgi:hypothetical protein